MTRFLLRLLTGLGLSVCLFQPTFAEGQVFTPGHLAVLRVGNGTETLINSGNTVFIDQYTESGTLVNTTALPDTGATALIESGTASSEGGLTRSMDYSELVLAGYNTNRGSVSGSLSSQPAAAVPRVIGVIDAFQNYQVFNGGPTLYNSNNVRGAASDGTNHFWTAGNGGGTFYMAPPQTPVPIQSGGNTRSTKIVGGSLYYSTQAGTAGIYGFQGGGLPTSAATPILLVPTGLNSQPAGFAMNLALTIAYVADQRATAGGIQKWTNNGSSWGLAYTFSTGSGAFDVTVDLSGPNPILYATTGEASANRLISISDTGPLSIIRVLATASANEVFRGLDFVPDLRPVIVSQPQSQTVTNGAQANFSVAVQSRYALSYQWQKNSSDIVGATSPTLALQNVSSSDQATYRVVVTNLYGSVISANATLTVNQVLTPPVITAQPSSQTVALGGTATFSVSASGTAPLSYQWSLNGAALVNQTNSNLVLPNAGPSAQGTYAVLVRNPAGSTNSQGATLTVTSPAASFVSYTTAGALYSQNFDSLPNPGTASVNADNPVKIGAVTYGVANPFDFSFPILPNSVDPNTGTGLGGLGLSNSMAGWYGMGGVAPKLGAGSGDQSTGGIISFGLTNSLAAATNRALGLLATSSTGPTAFGLKLLNQSSVVLGQISVQFTGELWRQAAVAKTLAFAYWIDPAATNGFSSNTTALVTSLNVSFPVNPAATNPVPTDGTAPANQQTLGATIPLSAPWAPGAALWLSWRMDDPTGKGQGLAIDNFVFSAAPGQTGSGPELAIHQSGGNVILSWPTAASGFQLQSNSSLSSPSGWSAVSLPVSSNNGTNSVIVPIGGAAQFFRLKQ
ncbi:MAG TPA: immunoglobulin domain-containing protein [Verrucomicrobiae bacterium]|nr:immunoglobulin domain-containing protein [Verrucomicrobiae bacterium]